MLYLSDIFWLLFAHLVGDLVLQTSYMARNKSRYWSVLLLHSFTYSIPFLFFVASLKGFVFLFLVFFTHFLIDGVSSRITSIFYNNGKIDKFAITICVDQAVHFFVLCYLYILIYSNSSVVAYI